jgi:hypothetical protein
MRSEWFVCGIRPIEWVGVDEDSFTFLARDQLLLKWLAEQQLAAPPKRDGVAERAHQMGWDRIVERRHSPTDASVTPEQAGRGLERQTEEAQV